MTSELLRYSMANNDLMAKPNLGYLCEQKSLLRGGHGSWRRSARRNASAFITVLSGTADKIGWLRADLIGRSCGRFLLSVTTLLALVLAEQASAEAVDVGHIVRANGIQTENSTIVVKRLSDGRIWVSNPERAQKRYSPASSSKIPHTLIAIESGVASPDSVFRWDKVPRSNIRWNQDHTLSSAFQYSVVWVYQEIARRAGAEKMSEWLVRFDYGNMNVGSSQQLETYWLDDTLQISASEQIEFLSKLALGRLPLSVGTYNSAKQIMVSDRGASWVIRSKTGWRYSTDSTDIGWFVGWLECASESYVFALNMDMPDTRFLSKRKTLAYSVLEDIGAFNCD